MMPMLMRELEDAMQLRDDMCLIKSLSVMNFW